jgi:putative heme iron utilization protein
MNEMPSKTELAADARGLVRLALKASLATIASGSSYPYASLITTATEASGAPIFLISGLAQHTKNLAENPRASILFDGTGAAGDPLQGARVTLWGRAEKVVDEAVRRRFLARHPEAAFYADFPDFAFWRLRVEGAHYIGGFGRIVDFAPEELLVDTEAARHPRPYERRSRRRHPPLCHAARWWPRGTLADERHRSGGLRSDLGRRCPPHSLR